MLKSTTTVSNLLVKYSIRSFSNSVTNLNYISPIKPGKIIAYDESLNFLLKDKESKLKVLEDLKLNSLTSKVELEKAEIEAFINDPEIRWNADNGLGDNSLPVYRELAERKWRRDGDLAILMQRVTQMSVVPDLISSIEPTVDLKVAIEGGTIVPGVFVLPEQTQDGIKITANVYHPETRLYTLLMIDPDVPDETTHSFTTFAHWLIPNITLSSTNSEISTLTTLLPYIPPHPQSGTPYHRYTIFLLAHPLNSETATYSTINLVEEAIEREGMNVRDFIKTYDLEPVGVSFFRQKWSRAVGDIYKKAFNGEEEKKFGPQPKVKRQSSGSPKYTLE